MKPLSESAEEIPRHRKRAPKNKRNRWAVQWVWTGDLDSISCRITRMFYSSSTQKYSTEKAARQAVADWEKGRGIYGAIRRPADGWVARVIAPAND